MEIEKDFLRPIQNTSIVQRVIARLTKAIIDREIVPGDKIPTESELAASFGVGRNSIREAIKILSSFGVLEIRRPEGTFVVDKFSEKMLDPLLYGIILTKNDSLDDLKELREWMDWGILQLAIEKSQENDVELLEQRYKDLKIALNNGDIDEIFKADNNFHTALDESAHNPLFKKIAKLVRTLTSEIRMRTIRSMSQQKKLNEMDEAHYILLNAVKNRDINLPRNILTDSYFYRYDVLKF